MFMLENNHYAMGTSVERSSMSPEFYNRLTYFAGIKVQCTDVFLARETLRGAKQWILEKESPL